MKTPDTGTYDEMVVLTEKALSLLKILSNEEVLEIFPHQDIAVSIYAVQGIVEEVQAKQGKLLEEMRAQEGGKPATPLS